ncbi:MAG: efflux RND transporter permease subunit [Planctomycetia bacterium]|nr:efflux RND transporter permease subunit [Planctomycetia bacterium]
MLAWLIDWSLRHRYLVLAAAAGVVAAGLFSLRRLNIDAFPDTTPVQVQINTVAPALVPEEMERQVTFPIELAISGMPGLEHLRSISQFGLSQVVVTFRDGTDIYFARQLINERLGTVEIPPGIDRPQMGPVATGLGEVLHYILLSEGESAGEAKELTELRTIHDWIVKPAMRPVPGTAEINSWGGFKKQYQVRIDPTRLIKHDLMWSSVVDAVRSNNLNVGGGSLNRSGDMLLVHGVGRTSTIEQIESIVVTAKAGVPIRVRDVADVTVGHEIRRGVVTANGEGEVVLGLGFMLMGESSYDVTRRMSERLKEVKDRLPSGVRLETVYDRMELVDHVIATVRENLFDGGLLVVIILFIFLEDLRAGLIVATAIPMAMLFGFCGMLAAGIAGTLLSLGAIDFGIVVDSSVVVVENVVRRLSHYGPVSGPERLRIIRDAAVEVRTPTVFGQLIIMIVYLPILTLQGVEGKMFRPMALTVIFVLTGSLILSLTLMPVLASFVLPKKVKETEALPVRVARRLYGPLLRFCLQARYAVLLLSAGALAAAAVVAMSMGSEFVPRLSEGAIVIGIVRPPGTSLEESIRVNTQMERMLLASFPAEISHTWSRVGAPEVATDASGVEQTDFFIALRPREEWRRAKTQAELVELIQREVADIPGQINWFTQPIEQRLNEMVSGVRADVALKVFGDDLESLVAKARELEAVFREVPGCVDLATEQVLGQPVLRIHIRQDEIARYGVPARLVLDIVESVGGTELGDVIEGQLRFPLAARLPENLRTDPETIGAILISTPAGERIPLSRLAEVGVVEGPKLISREWGKRRITVQCNVRGRDVGSFVADAQRRIAGQVSLPEGYRVEWGGQFESLERAKRRLSIVVPVALVMIGMLLFATYKNVTDTAIVFASVPFACVGGIAALALREMPLSISAAVGFITLSGVSVLNSMVLVSCLRGLLEKGLPLRDAIEDAALGCLRTIMMTALVASVGFIPMATSSGTGAEVQRPLATVVIGGVISSTLMTLAVLPAIYLVVGSRGKGAAAGN